MNPFNEVVVDLPPIAACPLCSYDLHGHPDAGQCPECGWEYGRSDCTIRATNPSKPLWAHRNTLWALWGVGALLYFVVYLKDPWAGLAVLSSLAFLLVFWRYSRLVRDVAMTGQGIIWLQGHRRVSAVPWCNVKSVAVAGGSIRGWCLVARPRYGWLYHIIPLGKCRETAERVRKQAEWLMSIAARGGSDGESSDASPPAGHIT